MTNALIKRAFAAALLFAVTEQGCAQQPEPPAPSPPQPVAVEAQALPADLDRVLRDYERGWRGRNADSLAVLFTPDGFILRPGHPPVWGRDAIAQAYRGSGGPLHLYALDYALADSIAYIIGGYRTAPERPDAGKFILTLRRMPDGRWYISADMDNANR